MKRVLYILTLVLVLGVVTPGAAALAEPRIEQVAADEANATGGKGCIAMTAGESDATFNVYSITGQLIKTVKVNAGTKATIDFPKGFYIVKCVGKWSRKVVVK